MADEPFNAADRPSIRARTKQAKVIESLDRSVMRSIMANGPGRAWMYRKLEACHIHTPSFAANPYVTAYREGERNIGLLLESEIMSACPDMYLLMLQERNLTDARRDANPTDNAGDADAADDSIYAPDTAEPGDSEVARDAE